MARFKPVKATELPSIIEMVRETMISQKLSIPKACEYIEISYASFMQRVNFKTRKELKEIGIKYRIGRGKKSKEKTPATLSSTLPLVVKPEPVEGFKEFPKIIYRVWVNNLIREAHTQKCRLFMRVEGDKYFMVGYEYETHPCQYHVDEHLYVYDKELPNAIQELRNLLQSRLDKGVKDDKLGEVRYALQKKEAPKEVLPLIKEELIPKTIQATTPIYLKDGEYECSISGDIGRIDYKEATFHFHLPDRFEKRSGVKIKVTNKEGILTL